jgi:hypothetical protein
VCRHKVFRCAANFYKKLLIRTLQLEKDNTLSFVIYIHTHTPHRFAPSLVLSNICMFYFDMPSSFRQVFICRYIFMTMYSFVPRFREATYCGVPLSVFDKLGCAAGEKRLRNTELSQRIKKRTHISFGPHVIFKFTQNSLSQSYIGYFSKTPLLYKSSRSYIGWNKPLPRSPEWSHHHNHLAVKELRHLLSRSYESGVLTTK